MTSQESETRGQQWLRWACQSNMGRKMGAAVPLSVGEAAFQSNKMSPGPSPTSVPSCILIYPSHGPKMGGCYAGPFQ